MRGLFMFVAGILVGTLIQTTFAQVPAGQPSVRLSHVAIAVADINEALKYYGEKLGFREVVRNTNQQGQVQAAYIQVSRDTFIELQTSNAQRPVGINHFGFEVQDIKNAVATWRGRGLMVSDPGAPSAFTGGINAGITDPNVGRIEISEQPAESKIRKAWETFK